MTDQNTKSDLIYMKLCIRKFLIQIRNQFP